MSDYIFKDIFSVSSAGQPTLQLHGNKTCSATTAVHQVNYLHLTFYLVADWPGYETAGR